MPTDATDAAIRPISAAIRYARTSREDTQVQLAERIGAGQMTISEWERGLIDVGDRALWRVATAYETTPEALIREYLVSITSEPAAFRAWEASRARVIEKS